MFARTTGCAVFFLIAGCVHETPPADAATDAPRTIEEMRAASLEAIDRPACEAGGGEVVQAGMLGLWRCTTPYADAGASCRDDSDCMGRCIAEDGVTDYAAAPGAAKGLCERDDSPFGCYAVIDEGVIGPTLCVD